MILDELNLFFCALAGLPALLLLVLMGLRRLQKKGALQTVWLLVSWNSALFLFFLASMLAGGETWYRFFVDRTDSVGFVRVAERWHQRHYQFNDQGWRDNIDYTLERRASRRITFLGDSYTAGSGIKNVEDRFSNIIRARLSDTELHILARNGYSTKHHLKTIEEILGWDYPTDAVVLAYMMNDVWFCMPDASTFFHKMRKYNQKLGYLERESYFLNALTFRWKSITDPDLKKFGSNMRLAYNGPCWERNLAALREIHQRLLEKNIPLLVVTFPFVQALDRYTFGAEHERLGDFWKAEGVPHLDLLSLFLEHAHESLAVHKWDGHPNELANELAADAIYAFLASEGVIHLPRSRAPR